MGKTRYKSIDIIKGLAIIWVVWFHAYKRPDFVLYMWSVPIFFFIAGMFTKTEPIKAFLVKIVKQLVIPLILFNAVCLIWDLSFYIIVGGAIKDFDTHYFWFFVHGDAVQNLPLWFLCSLITIKIIWRGLKCFFPPLMCFVVSLAFAICDRYFGLVHTPVMYLSETVYFLPIFCLGNWIGQRTLQFVSENRKKYLIYAITVAALIGSLICERFWDKTSSVPGLLFNHLSSFLLFVSLLFLTIRENLQSWLNWLTFFGLNTLAILCLHYPVLRAILSQIEKWMPLNIFNNLCAVAITVLIMIPLCMLINKYLPEMTGKWRSVRSNACDPRGEMP